MRRRLTTFFKCLVGLPLVVGCAVTAFLYYDAQGVPEGRPVYVALGSSFAAGPALGARQKDSPLACSRTLGSYPQQLARLRGLPMVDMSCGGAVTRHVLHGGQLFQGPQLRALGPETRLVTLTVGGNDVGYIGDISMQALRNSSSVGGWLAARLWSGPLPLAARDFAGLHRELVAILIEIHRRAPHATVVVATYPTVLPSTGTCAKLSLSEAEVTAMRVVGDRLAETTRSAAQQGGAVLVDMHRIGAAHHVCSADPWVRGWVVLSQAPFHPTLRGAEATAREISKALDALPAGVPAVGENNAAGHQARGVRGKKVHN